MSPGSDAITDEHTVPHTNVIIQLFGLKVDLSQVMWFTISRSSKL